MMAARALLALLWLLFGLTTTAHAGVIAPESPCHMQTMKHMHSPALPAQDDATLMPCCSQPAAIAPTAVTIPRSARLQAIRLEPATPTPLTSHLPAFEPRPPQAA